MSKENNKFDEFINNNPKESLQLVLTIICLVWQTPVGVLGGLIYLVISKILKMKWWILLSLGVVFALGSLAYYAHTAKGVLSFNSYIAYGFLINKIFWKKAVTCHGWCSIQFLYRYDLIYLAGLPLLLAGLLSSIDLIQDDPHKKTIKALQRGEHVNEKKELSERKIQSALNKIDENKHDGTVLGVSKYSGNPVVIPDYYINQVVLVLGTTGSGKTVTLQRFYKRAITKGYPLIIVDGKPTEKNVRWISDLASRYGRKFHGFNCGNHAKYDSLANGGFTELKDKIISLKDQWENDYYKSIAEDYLQAAFQVLLKLEQPFDLKRVINCLDYDELLELASQTNDQELVNRVNRLGGYDKKDISGLQAHLSLLIHSELGHYFASSENAFSLKQAIAENAVVYFALPALRYPSFSKVLGKLVINDMKAVIDRNEEKDSPIFTVFDEFSVFAGEQVLNLVNMGRGKGVHAIFGTQGLADLSRVDAEFKSQILNCANTIICHRLNDQSSAEDVAAWIGTEDTFTVTAQYDPTSLGMGLGSIKADKAYIVHPEETKQGLRVGEAFFVSKIKSKDIVKALVCH